MERREGGKKEIDARENFLSMRALLDGLHNMVLYLISIVFPTCISYG